MSMSTSNQRQWWSYSKEEQKRLLEDAVEEYLSQPGELSDREKLLLRDAIGHTYRGLFGMAAHDLGVLRLPESAWGESARVDPAMVDGITRERLERALRALRGAPVQEQPVFM
jgi:hypothetical protein